VRFSTPS